MTDRLSAHLGIDPDSFRQKGVLDPFLGIDAHLFVDPYLLRTTSIPEFADSRKKIERYYTNILKLLKASKSEGDVAWRQARRHLIFKELRGTSIGYGVKRSDGNAIGPVLGERLLRTADEIVGMGIDDPEIFELVGLFEEGFGADRLSDMTIAIITDELLTFSDRITRELRIDKVTKVRRSGRDYLLPTDPITDKGLFLLPTELLRDLPVALSWEEIGDVVAVNQMLRDRVNELIGKAWRRSTRLRKSDVRALFLGQPRNLKRLIKHYRELESKGYDFDSDPAGELLWHTHGYRFASQNPLALALSSDPTIDDFEDTVRQIVDHFKKLVELNGLNELLYIKDESTGELKPRKERYSQLLFYAIADSHCIANDLDINREPNAGTGPVDFKLSKGYEKRLLVELKLSSSSHVLKGYTRQLPTYAASESTQRSIYVILRVTRSDAAIKDVLRQERQSVNAGTTVPAVVVIDARIKPSASKR